LSDARDLDVNTELREVDALGRGAFDVRILLLKTLLELVFQAGTDGLAVRHAE